MKQRRTVIAFALVLVVGIGGSAQGVSTDDAARAAVRLSAQPIEGNDDWRRYVMDDADGIVYPVAVTIQGDRSAVDNPDGLNAEGGAVTTIRSSGSQQSPTPALILDLGLNTGGFIEIGVTGSDGTPFRLGYSEAREFLRPIGDITPRPGGIPTSFGTDDDPDHRNDVFDPEPGRCHNASSAPPCAARSDGSGCRSRAPAR